MGQAPLPGSADIVPGNPPFRPDFGQIKGGFPGGGSSQDDNLDTTTGTPPLEPENEQPEDRFCSVFPLQIAF